MNTMETGASAFMTYGDQAEKQDLISLSRTTVTYLDLAHYVTNKMTIFQNDG